MTAETRRPLQWSKQLDILPRSATPSLRGDKIILPPAALEQLLAAATVTVDNTDGPQPSAFDPFNPQSFATETFARRQRIEQQQVLPNPLTFKLVNPENGKAVFAGIREFSAPDETVGLSTFLSGTLGIKVSDSIQASKPAEEIESISQTAPSEGRSLSSRLTVHAHELPKGTYVRLRPLEAGYDVDDWKALLEQHLRDTFTTLTDKETITIPAGRETVRFLVDGLKPNHEAVSLVDTDIEVDIEPLDEDQARETLQRLAQKAQRAPGTKDGSSVGGKLRLGESETGQVLPNDYIDYSVECSDSSLDYEIEVTSLDDDSDIDIFANPFTRKNRERPRDDNYVFGDFSSAITKRIHIRHTNVELEDSSALRLSVRGYPAKDSVAPSQPKPVPFSIRVSVATSVGEAEDPEPLATDTILSADEEPCLNCHQSVPKRTMFLHRNFCLRNNVVCPKCQNVFQKTSDEWKQHWHCEHDDAYGNAAYSKSKHERYTHVPVKCPSCDYQASNIQGLAHHRTTACPSKLILCRFCHLQVPQRGPDDPAIDSAEVLLSGLTPHEVSDGARTTECHLCNKIVRFRDMSAHLHYHDLERLRRGQPRTCRNVNCGHTLDTVTRTVDVKPQAAHNDLGVCDTCYGPFYVSSYDPDGKALRRRVERKCLTQLLTGCGQSWCQNEMCKTGRQHRGILPRDGATITSKEATRMIKPIVEHLADGKTPVCFCTDEKSQRRRTLAEMMAAETEDDKHKGKACASNLNGQRTNSGYELGWCVAALNVEEGDLDRARAWLKGFAPTRAEAAAR